MTQPVDALFRPQGIAIAGASPNSGAAKQIVEGLQRLGYEGGIYPLNPKYDEFLGLPCYPSFEAMPGEVSAAAIVTGASAAVSLLEQAGQAGVAAASIGAVGFKEAGEEGQKLQDELLAVATRYGMAVNGPNCMGVMGPAYRSTMYTGGIEDPVGLLGTTGLISQSGSAAIALLAQTHRIGFSLLVSSGNEAVTTAADYLQYMVRDPKTERVALFVEAIRDPALFREAAAEAADLGKPVIALKVGKSQAAARNVVAHSGALAGSARATSAFLEHCGVIEVQSLAEMLETLVAFEQRVLPSGPGIGVTHPSGGEASHLLDLAEELDLSFPELKDETRSRILAAGLPEGFFIHSRNPLDVWGPASYTESYPACLDALAAQDDIGAMILLQDAGRKNTDAPSEVSLNVADYATEVQRSRDTPIFLVSNVNQDIDPEVAEKLADGGIPALIGTREALRAIRHWLDFSLGVVGEARTAGVVDAGSRASDREVSLPIEGAGSLDEVESKQLLATFGAPVAEERVANDWPSVQQAADEVGYPVVLKAVGRALEHKSDHGLVAVNLRDEVQLKEAFETLEPKARSLGSERFLVAPMVRGARELIVGVTRDETYGLMLVVGAGGVLAEVLDDAALGVPPVRTQDARRMVDRLRTRKVLDAWRGQPAADLDAVAAAIVSLSDLAVALGDRLESAEINPLAVLPQGEGAVALDALVVLR